MQKENKAPSDAAFQYVGPYRLEKTLGKGQTGEHAANNRWKTVSLKKQSRRIKPKMFSKELLRCHCVYGFW